MKKTPTRNTSERFGQDRAKRRFLQYAMIAIGCTCLPALIRPAGAAAKEGSLPNIIIIYADDLGYGDVSCYNAKCAYKTPRLDRMAAEGIRFADAHSPSTICSPSRYGASISTLESLLCHNNDKYQYIGVTL